jgi:hypothetical protein
MEVTALDAKHVTAVRVTQKDCDAREKEPTNSATCTGVPVALERNGSFVRPKVALPDGARVQILARGKHVSMFLGGPDADENKLWVLEDFTVRKSPAAKTAPAWNGVSVTSATVKKPISQCDAAGPTIELAIKPAAKVSLDNTFLLVWLKKPDLKAAPSFEYIVSHHENKAMLAHGHTTSLLSMPARIWVSLADGDGNVGTPVEIEIKQP